MDLRFDFTPAELTSQIRQASKRNPTGYWTIQFEGTEEHEAVEWCISLLEGKVIYCGLNVPTCKDFLDVMQRFSGLRKGVMGQHMKMLRSTQIEKQGKQVKQMIRQLVMASLVTMEEIEKSFKIYIL